MKALAMGSGSDLMTAKPKLRAKPKSTPVEIPIWEKHGLTETEYHDIQTDPSHQAYFDSDDPDKYPGWEMQDIENYVQEYRTEDFA